MTGDKIKVDRSAVKQLRRRLQKYDSKVVLCCNTITTIVVGYTNLHFHAVFGYLYINRILVFNQALAL